MDHPDIGAAVAAAIEALLDSRAPHATICPSEVARSLVDAGASWRPLMPAVREAAADLVRQSRAMDGTSTRSRPAGPFDSVVRRIEATGRDSLLVPTCPFVLALPSADPWARRGGRVHDGPSDASALTPPLAQAHASRRCASAALSSNASSKGSTMNTYRLGDRSVSRIGYCAIQLAGPGVFGPPNDRAAARASPR